MNFEEFEQVKSWEQEGRLNVESLTNDEFKLVTKYVDFMQGCEHIAAQMGLSVQKVLKAHFKSVEQLQAEQDTLLKRMEELGKDLGDEQA